MSHDSTLSQSPISPSDEQQRRDERKSRLELDWYASFPSNQFRAQKTEELRRIQQCPPRTPLATDYYKLAEANVKRRWVEQGIWHEKRTRSGTWCWKHELPLELESESETEPEAEGPAPLFGLGPLGLAPKRRRPKSAEELQRIRERRPVREREREASRPFHQFLYQVSRERERIEAESRAGPDVNTQAYETVRSTWTKRGIWNRKWGVLPGMSWKHEQPLEEMLREEMGEEEEEHPAPGQTAAVLGDNRHETGEALPQQIFRSLASSHGPQPAGSLHVAQQELPAVGRAAALEEDGRGARGVWPRQTTTQPSPPTRRIFGNIFGNLNASRPEPSIPATHEGNVHGAGGALPRQITAQPSPPTRGIFGNVFGNLNASQPEPPIPAIQEGNVHGAGGTPPSRISVEFPAPIESDHDRASDGRDAPQLGPLMAVDAAGSRNSSANPPSRVPTPRQTPTESRRTSHAIPPQRQRRGKGKLSGVGRRAPSSSRTTLGPAHPSKVAKTRAKSRPRPRQPNASEPPPEAQPSPLALDTPGPPTSAAPVPPRRSKRLQEAEHKRAAGAAGNIKTDSKKISPGLAKPQGVSKRQRPSKRR